MEAIKISQLPKKAELTGEETIPASTGTKETNRITARQIADLASSTPGPEGPPGPQGKPGADAEVPIVQETGNSVSNTMSQKATTDALATKQNNLTPEQLNAVNSGVSTATVEQVSTNQAQIASVKELIPDTATVDNPLTDKNFVNSSINAVAAYLITADAQGAPFSTHAALESATTFYSGGQERVPTQNDYCIVLADENYDGATTRYSYQGEAGSGVWAFAYKINDKPLTAAQVAALESGITASLVEKYNGYAGQIADKANSADVPVITMTTTDPGEGSDLAVGQFIAVYDGATE